MNSKVKKLLKKSKYIRTLHKKIVSDYAEKKEFNYNIDEITDLIPKEGYIGDELRFNLVIPTLKKEFIFGGISTALSFFFEISKEQNQRIILSDSDVHEEDLSDYPGFEIIKLGKNSVKKKQVVACNDRKFNKLNVANNDIFIATSWWSAYILIPVIKWQNENFGTKHQLIYLIQDYEPGFYPWSSRFLLADSTYSNEIDTIAVFNTKLLKDFLNNKGKKFYKEYFFEPILNKELHNCLLSNKEKKKKKVIVYGRPSVDRNCFEIVVGALKKLLEIYPDANEWDFISMGELHKPILLNDNKTLASLGKVSLDEYAKVMSEAYVGLSLMVSPHPSYPPLEMSTFGVSTITNVFENKNLNTFNDFIISCDNCNYSTIANEMKIKMEDFPNMHKEIINSEYIEGDNQFSVICQSILTDIR